MGVMDFLKKLKTAEGPKPDTKIDLPPLPPDSPAPAGPVDFPDIKIDAPQFAQTAMPKDEKFPFPPEMHNDAQEFASLLGSDNNWDEGIDELPGLQPVQQNMQPPVDVKQNWQPWQQDMRHDLKDVPKQPEPPKDWKLSIPPWQAPKQEQMQGQPERKTIPPPAQEWQSDIKPFPPKPVIQEQWQDAKAFPHQAPQDWQPDIKPFPPKPVIQGQWQDAKPFPPQQAAQNWQPDIKPFPPKPDVQDQWQPEMKFSTPTPQPEVKPWAPQPKADEQWKPADIKPAMSVDNQSRNIDLAPWTQPKAAAPWQKPETRDPDLPWLKKEEIRDPQDFVSYTKFQNIVDMVNSLSKETKIAEDTVYRLKEINDDKEDVVGTWQAVLEDIEKDLVEFDQALFG